MFSPTYCHLRRMCYSNDIGDLYIARYIAFCSYIQEKTTTRMMHASRCSVTHTGGCSDVSTVRPESGAMDGGGADCPTEYSFLVLRHVMRMCFGSRSGNLCFSYLLLPPKHENLSKPISFKHHVASVFSPVLLHLPCMHCASVT